MFKQKLFFKASASAYYKKFFDFFLSGLGLSVPGHFINYKRLFLKWPRLVSGNTSFCVTINLF